jgi:hypothetical protein
MGDSTRRRSVRRGRVRPSTRLGTISPWLLASALVGIIYPLAGSALRADEMDAPSPAQGHAAVIAHGVVRMPPVPVAWRVVRREAPPFPDRIGAGDLRLGFIVAEETPLLVWAENERWRLGAGEAVLIEAGDSPKIASLRRDRAAYVSLELVPAGEADQPVAGALIYTGEEFAVPGGNRDLDLVRDVLAVGETAHLDGGDWPVLVLALSGTLGLVAGDRPISLAAGKAATAIGQLRLTGQSASTTFVAAVIGPEMLPLRTPAPTQTPGVPSPSPTSPAEPTPAVRVTPAEAARPSPADLDGDGLSNVDEYLLGTNHRDADTDDDGFPDGEEVTAGTDPKDARDHP